MPFIISYAIFMSIARNIAWNTGVQVVGKIATAAIGLVTLSMISGYLGPAGYGDYSAVYDFLVFFAIIADMGLYTIAIREMAKDEEKRPMIIGNIFTVRSFVLLIMMGIACGASFFYGHPESKIVFAIAVPIVALTNFFGVTSGTISTILQVYVKMEYSSIGSVLGKIVGVSGMAFVIFFLLPNNSDQGFYYLLWAGVAGNIVMFLYTFYYANKYVSIRLRFDRVFMKEVIVKALPYGVAIVLNALYFRIGSILLYNLKGADAEGIYALPLKILEAINILSMYFMNSVLPPLTKAIKNKSREYHAIIQYSFDFLIMTGVAVAFGIAVTAYPIIHLFIRPEFWSDPARGFYGSDYILQVVIFALAFSFLTTLFSFILVAVHQQAKILYITGSGAIIAVVLNLILIPLFGARGPAFTSVIVELYVVLAGYFVAKKCLDFKLKFTNMYKILFSGLVMALALYFSSDFISTFLGFGNKSIVILIPLGGVIYISLLFATKVITKDMLLIFRKKKAVLDVEIRDEI